MTRAGSLTILVLALGCGTFRSRWTPRWSSSAPSRVVARADALAGTAPRDARDLYTQIVRDYPDDPAAAQALFGLARLQVDPDSPLLDYRGARATFKRLLARYPKSPWAADARAWDAALAELAKQEAETARLRGDLRDLKELDMELERRR